MLETVLLGLVATVTLVYWYLSHTYGYWRRKGLPQAPVVYGFGNYLDVVLLKTTPEIVCDQIYCSNPDREAVGVYDFLKPKLLLRSPELIWRVMVSDFSSFHDNEFSVSKKLDPHFYRDPAVLKGEEWKPSRTKLLATNTTARMKEIFPLMKEIFPRFEAYLDNYLGKDLDAKELSTLFTMDNVTNVVFGISSNCFTDTDAAFRKMADIQMNDVIYGSWSTMVVFSMPKLRDLLGLKVIPTVVIDYIERMVKEVLDYRIKNNVNRNDLFQYFMKKGHDLNELVFYAITFFFEGFETSSLTASKAIYELAMNPEVQQRAYEEVRDAFEGGTDIDYDTINRLTYLEKIILETLRKYPVTFNLIRECTKPISLEIEGKSVEIEPGTPIIVPVFSVHRDPKYFPDPEVFNPDRNSEDKATRPSGTFMPFGVGPRTCPGTKFAQVQVKLLISYLLYKYKIVCCEKTPKKLTFSNTFFIVAPDEEMWIRIEKRK